MIKHYRKIIFFFSFSLIVIQSQDTLYENLSKSLNQELIEISDGSAKMEISVDILSKMVENNVILEEQAKDLWRLLYLEKTSYTENPKIDNETIASKENQQENENIDNETNTEEKQNMGFYHLMIILLVGYVILSLVLNYFILGLYMAEKFYILLALLLFSSYNLTVVAKSQQDHMEANFLPAIIYITSFAHMLLAYHILLIFLKVQGKVGHWSDLFNMDMNRKGKISMMVYGVILSYFFAFTCLSPLVQIPFYLFLLFTINFIRENYWKNINSYCQPSLLFSFSAFSFLLLGYIYLRGENSFHEGIFILQSNKYTLYWFSFIGEIKITNFVDFRFFGYLICIVIINIWFPIYLFIQSKNLWNKTEFTYEKALLNFKDEIGKESIEFDKTGRYFSIYAVIVVFLIIFTLRERFLLGTLICLLCLVNLLNMSLRNNTFIGNTIS